ncbi:uncharacterized protein LOC120338299 [Styela clava]
MKDKMAWEGFGWKTRISGIKSDEDDDLFYSEVDPGEELTEKDKENLLKFIEKDIIGRDAIFDGPFGPRKVLYCDYVASGKALHSIENFMMKQVSPMYANTHTTTTVTSSQTTSFRKEAKEIIRDALGADDDDVVIFTGSGVTGAVHKLISVLNLPKPPVVFCGPFEHHSNLLPWREMNSHVVNISESADGRINLRHLEIALRAWANSGRPLIGSFSAASNVTGITTDTRKVAALLHKYGAISLWDYATAGPYMDIQMHPEPIGKYNTSKDAVFISMHKFVGSPDAPGLLIASKHLFRNAVPSGCGGGTVLFVSENDHRYLKDIESREEGGTPAIIGSIRAGLAFKLKMAVGCDVIMKRETELYARAMEVWKDIPELEILGILDEKPSTHIQHEHRLAVFSFLIKNANSGYYLHHNFVAALLNDLFGIQSRGGCACAGVYAQHLLGIDRVAEKKFGGILIEDPKRSKTRTRHDTERTEYEVLRPGFTRLNLTYFLSDEDADYIISAVSMIAKHGWTLLPQYQYGARSGEWKHTEYIDELSCKKLEDLSFRPNGLHFSQDRQSLTIKKGLPTSRIDCLKRAERIFFNAKQIVGKNVEDQRPKYENSSVRDMRWFMLPYEAQCILKGKKIDKKSKLIFHTRRKITQLTEEEIEKNVSNNVPLRQRNGIINPNLISDSNEIIGQTENTLKHDENAKPRYSIKGIGLNNNVTKSEKKKKAFEKFWSALTCKTKTSVDIIQ